ncbi:AUGMIN subunit 6 [Amborella trichopoda]|uniref:AUGMIN subunit 6 n=1 Tax=Amborella trichopoda TaxID=13333 RepID=UPI0005D39D31|nr:AUGMIN subunit 6 [Amborella trichopoda]|eukprot:XP_011626146.1 AUGMIN subunit 6 [Amborella trichopoda]
MEREKEREGELETAMYTNCLLLGLDPSILPEKKVGLFKHSNPRMGEILLHFILSALRGPSQSAKDFDKVWPIFDSGQSRDFRKIVQGIIHELESQGALPRSNSRVSSLATCCGPRFVELLWQLSFHALREVHRRTFQADVVSNPLPASLTDVPYMHAATLLPVTKARIALERRRFLKNATTAVHRQATWSSLAHDMTAEFRGLCAEEAYLQQELEKLQDMRNKAKLEEELWDFHVSGSMDQKPHLVSKATRLWESLLSRKGQHEVLASGPIEDLIAHREHRYRISGTSLLVAMDQSSHVPHADALSAQLGDLSLGHSSSTEQLDESSSNSNRDKPRQNLEPTLQVNDETFPRVDDRSGRVHPTVDVAEILRRWTHALQRIHKQSLHLAKANDGEGPELLRCSADGSNNGHAESLEITLAEHRQHLASIQVLINQLKEVIPAMKESVSELREEVNSISSTAPATMYGSRSMPFVSSQSNGRAVEESIDEDFETNSKFSTQLELVPPSPALKLPHLFSSTPNSFGKSGITQKRNAMAPQINKLEALPECSTIDQTLPDNFADNSIQENDDSYIVSIRRSVREAALPKLPEKMETLQGTSKDDSTEHYFVPLTGNGFSHGGLEHIAVRNRSKQKLFESPEDTSFLKKNSLDLEMDFRKNPTFLEDNDVPFSPPLLTDTSFLPDAFEDLLAPLSDIDAALMEC